LSRPSLIAFAISGDIRSSTIRIKRATQLFMRSLTLQLTTNRKVSIHTRVKRVAFVVLGMSLLLSVSIHTRVKRVAVRFLTTYK